MALALNRVLFLIFCLLRNLKDENSQHGTYLNDTKLEPACKYQIQHGDIIQLGQTCKLLAHFHPGKSTCGECEHAELKSDCNELYVNPKPKNEKQIVDWRVFKNRSLRKKYLNN